MQDFFFCFACQVIIISPLNHKLAMMYVCVTEKWWTKPSLYKSCINPVSLEHSKVKHILVNEGNPHLHANQWYCAITKQHL